MGSDEKKSNSSEILKMIGSIPNEIVSVYLLIGWVLQPNNPLMLIGAFIGGIMVVKNATFPIKIIKFVKAGESERVELTEARKYTFKENDMNFQKLSIIGKKTDVAMPDAKFSRFNKRNMTNLFQGESFLYNVVGENYTPVFKPQGSESFISEADRHEQIQDMKRRKERIESSDNKDKLLAYVPYIVLILTGALVIWTLTELQGIIVTDLPHAIRVSAGEFMKEVFTIIEESGQTINGDSVANAVDQIPI